MQFEELSDSAKKIVEIFRKNINYITFYDKEFPESYHWNVITFSDNEHRAIPEWHAICVIGKLNNSSIKDCVEAYKFCEERNYFIPKKKGK